MPARAISSATISFGLVAIPVKLYTATASKQVRFNMLHPETKGRVKQQYVEPKSGAVVERSQLIKGYEYQKGQYVVFDEDELKKLEADRSTSLDIVEFVPLSSVDLLHVEKSYYLGPDKGGDKAYRLLTQSMKDTEKVAVGRWAARGKEQLVLLRPYRDGILLHQLFYADEVRAFDEVDTGATFEFKEIELSLAEKLISELSSERFDPQQYGDEYAARVLSAVEQKVAGQEVHLVQEVPKAQIIDLFEALKQSVEGLGDEAAAASHPRPEPSQEPHEAAPPAPAAEEVEPRPVKKAVPRKPRRKNTG